MGGPGQAVLGGEQRAAGSGGQRAGTGIRAQRQLRVRPRRRHGRQPHCAVVEHLRIIFHMAAHPLRRRRPRRRQRGKEHGQAIRGPVVPDIAHTPLPVGNRLRIRLDELDQLVQGGAG